MKKIITTIIVFMLFTTIAWAQSGSAPSLPQLTTPSPKASMMDRFGLYPTNLYTGLVDITVPIHTIKVKGITIPIEFKYHASGLKYDDLPMEVGYGWTLMAGGTVSYSTRGVGLYPPNGIDRSPFIKDVYNIAKDDKTGNPDSDQLQLQYAADGNKTQSDHVDYYRDSEYDVYNFSFPGHWGQLYRLSDGTSFTTPSTAAYFNGGFRPEAKDEYGNEYKFELSDMDTYNKNYTHYLTRIISANHADTINFVYKQVYWGTSEMVKRPIIDGTYSIKATRPYTGSGLNFEFIYGGSGGISSKDFNTPILSEINYKGGKVQFTYSATYKRSLEQIDIKDQLGQLIRSVTLDKTNNSSYLTKVNFKDKNRSSVYSYQFEYNGTKLENNFAIIDYWGYYTGYTSSNGFYVPNFNVYIPGYGNHRIQGMDRTPNEGGMQAGVLKKIVYPTKGYSNFTYEAHRANNQIYGGLRIKKIDNYDENNNLLESKWYKYGQNENGNGRAVNPVAADDYVSSYMSIESLTESSLLGNQINISSYGAFPRCSYFSNGSTVVYSQITEYTGISTGSNGKIEYVYSDYMDQYERTMRGFVTDIPKWSNTWKNGKLVRKEVMDSNGKVMYSLDNYYEGLNEINHLNLKVMPYAEITGTNNSAIANQFSKYPNFSSIIGGSLHDYYNYYVTSGNYAVTESREYTDGITKTTKYQYNELGQIIKQTLIDSEGNERINQYKYPYELQKESPSTSIYKTMYQRNILAPVLKKEEYKGTTLSNQIVNEYKDWGGYLIAPQYVKQLNYYEPRIKYLGYDSQGNPTGVRKDDTEQTYYLWGYKGQRVIAEIEEGSFSTLGQTFIDRVTKAAIPSDADMLAIEALRDNTASAKCRLTTYYYNTALELSRKVAPNGIRTSYEYDTFGRLARIKDPNGKIMEEYQYDYKQ